MGIPRDATAVVLEDLFARLVEAKKHVPEASVFMSSVLLDDAVFVKRVTALRALPDWEARVSYDGKSVHFSHAGGAWADFRPAGSPEPVVPATHPLVEASMKEEVAT